MTSTFRARRRFSFEDQRRFAELTGDFNPIHLDPLAARRTLAGAPIVHGIHSLLWLIDALAEHHPELASMADVNVRFSRMLYVGEEVEARIVERSQSALRAQIVADGTAALDLSVAFGPARPAGQQLLPVDAITIAHPACASEPALHEMEHQAGRVAFAHPASELARLFPHAARVLGSCSPAALGCSSFVIGMLVPGLHSLYSSLSFSISDDVEPEDVLAFNLVSVMPRFSRVRVHIRARGLDGQIEAFVRRAPTRQADVASLGKLVSKDEFTGAEALVIGGSRGLGELTANLLAAGGARVTITYVVGAADAERVASRIRATGRECDAVHFDARGDADRQIQRLRVAPTHVYYFATPPIFRQRGRVFTQAMFDDFNCLYVSGFQAIAQACAKRSPAGVSLFYPSSEAVEGPPSNLLEYAMSKAAGEVLCAGLRKQNEKIRIHVARLARLATDQTATLLNVQTKDAAETLLPIVRAVQSAAPGSTGAFPR